MAEGTVATTLQNETAYLPPPTEKPEEDEYKPKLGLDFAGQPSIGVGADPFGAYASGGVSFLFSDILGNHLLATSAQVTVLPSCQSGWMSDGSADPRMLAEVS